MSDREPEVDPQTIHVLNGIGNQVLKPAIDRNFGDDSAAEFVAAQVVGVSVVKKMPGETVPEAHLRIQSEGIN